MNDMTDLGDFLRTRRARVSPREAGLGTETGVRRVPGLRREEVARLAGVSVDYYVRLERGRQANASEAVLEALARALRLDTTERDHLFALARPGRAQALPVQKVAPGLDRVLETMRDVPALVLGRRMDVLASNPMARAFYTDFEALPVRERNMVRFIFLNPVARGLYADWPESARGTVAVLHRYAGRFPHDPRLDELVDELSARDPDFRRWWAEHDVMRRAYGVKHYRHPVAGEMVLSYQSLTPEGDREQSLGLHFAEPGSPSEERLRLLAERAGVPAAARP
ncbi:helix-turn-helix transcriptional regulator [Actinacidiphila acididurans]|uniref:Helix-turn-helix domain-containing protein n=1 Tax=Actinacidiphila acididurans TaxID=2784346 RepID=A0ABS2TZH7_9ACTN|nr:helix-turn-helix domain-containing protein [Actinacidiphila acididurans]